MIVNSSDSSCRMIQAVNRVRTNVDCTIVALQILHKALIMHKTIASVVMMFDPRHMIMRNLNEIQLTKMTTVDFLEDARFVTRMSSRRRRRRRRKTQATCETRRGTSTCSWGMSVLCFQKLGRRGCFHTRFSVSSHVSHLWGGLSLRIREKCFVGNILPV